MTSDVETRLDILVGFQIIFISELIDNEFLSLAIKALGSLVVIVGSGVLVARSIQRSRPRVPCGQTNRKFGLQCGLEKGHKGRHSRFNIDFD